MNDSMDSAVSRLELSIFGTLESVIFRAGPASEVIKAVLELPITVPNRGVEPELETLTTVARSTLGTSVVEFIHFHEEKDGGTWVAEAV